MIFLQFHLLRTSDVCSTSAALSSFVLWPLDIWRILPILFFSAESKDLRFSPPFFVRGKRLILLSTIGLHSQLSNLDLGNPEWRRSRRHAGLHLHEGRRSELR